MKNQIKLMVISIALSLSIGFLVGNNIPTVNVVTTTYAQTTSQKAGFITNYRLAIDRINFAMEAEKTLRSQYNALGLSSALVDGDFTGDNQGITAAQFTAAIGSMDTMQTAYGATVRQNLYRIGH